MKLGGFGRIADYGNIQQAGFDYAEMDIPEIEALPEHEFWTLCEKVHNDGFPMLIGARALPITEPWFFTEHFCMVDYKNYLENACKRAKALGIKKIILGNGKSRLLPDEDSIKKESRFIEFMRMFAEIAGNCGGEVILEPLGPKYTNYINTLPEAVRVLREVNMPNLFTMADLRHMLGAGEPLEDIAVFVDYIHHIHIDYPRSYPERLFPKQEDDFDYMEFQQVLKKSGYNGTLTVEADIPRDWDCAYRDAVSVLKEVL